MFPDNRATGFCSWHIIAYRNPRFNTVEEFARYAHVLYDAFYCCDLTHYDVGVLWPQTRGIVSDVPAPRACKQPGCRYAAATAGDEQVETFRQLVRLGGWEQALTEVRRHG